MAQSIEWLHLFISHYPYLGYVVVFFAVIAGGGFTLFVLGFLAAQKVISLFSFTLLSLIAVLLSDSVWFFLARTETLRRIVLHRYANGTISAITEAIRRVSRGSHTKAFIFAKLLVATPVILILYLSKTDLTFKKFMYHNLLGIFVWLLIGLGTGFISGLGFTYLAQVFQNVYTAIGLIILVIIIGSIFKIWFKERLSDTS